jgi:hypothetical protein
MNAGQADRMAPLFATVLAKSFRFLTSPDDTPSRSQAQPQTTASSLARVPILSLGRHLSTTMQDFGWS